MTPTDNTFFEEYKRLDKICSDMYSTSGGVSQYILDMENHFSVGAWQVDGWKKMYGELMAAFSVDLIGCVFVIAISRPAFHRLPGYPLDRQGLLC